MIDAYAHITWYTAKKCFNWHYADFIHYNIANQQAKQKNKKILYQNKTVLFNEK